MNDPGMGSFPFGRNVTRRGNLFAPSRVPSGMGRRVLVLIGAAIAAGAAVLTAAALGLGLPGDGDDGARTGGAAAASPVASGGPAIRPGPEATLVTANGAAHTAAAGTRCWAGACIDYVGPLTNVTPIAVAPGERLTLTFAPGVPREQTLQWLPVTGAAPHPGPGGIAWSMPPGGGIPAQPGSLAAPAEPGRYLLVSFAWWAQGDAGHAWYLEVR